MFIKQIAHLFTDLQIPRLMIKQGLCMRQRVGGVGGDGWRDGWVFRSIDGWMDGTMFNMYIGFKATCQQNSINTAMKTTITKQHKKTPKTRTSN